MSKKIIFKSALGYWDGILKKLFPGYNVAKWDIDFDAFEKDNCPELKEGTNVLNGVEHFPVSECLYVYVAPITWASRYMNDGFKIIGPAFGTKNSLSVFAGTYKYSKDPDNNIITVGTIGKYITSTALFLVYHLFMEYIFSTNIHLLSIDGKIDDYDVDRIIFKFKNIPKKTLRFNCLKKSIDIDYSIFTIEDIHDLNLYYEDGIREVLKVDPILSHIFNIGYIPRTVYCIHESQLDMEDALDEFYECLIANSIHYSKYDEENSIVPIHPEDENSQKVQNLILKYFKKMLELDRDNIPEDIVPKFNNLEYFSLTR